VPDLKNQVNCTSKQLKITPGKISIIRYVERIGFVAQKTIVIRKQLLAYPIFIRVGHEAF
jgi:hypothetical protein